MENRKLVVERRVRRILQPTRVAEQLQRCAEIAMKNGRGRGWMFSIGQVIPEEWMKEAVGSGLSPDPMLAAASNALEAIR